MKDLISRGLLGIEHKQTLEQLATIRFKFDSYGRKAMIRKEDMKKEGITSPDMADALMMAVSEVHNIGRAITVTKRQAVNQPRYAAKSSVLRKVG